LRLSLEGRLGIDDPLDAAKFGETFGEGGRPRKFGELAEEAQFSRLERSLERLEEQPAEEPGEHADR